MALAAVRWSHRLLRRRPRGGRRGRRRRRPSVRRPERVRRLREGVHGHDRRPGPALDAPGRAARRPRRWRCCSAPASTPWASGSPGSPCPVALGADGVLVAAQPAVAVRRAPVHATTCCGPKRCRRRTGDAATGARRRRHDDADVRAARASTSPVLPLGRHGRPDHARSDRPPVRRPRAGAVGLAAAARPAERLRASGSRTGWFEPSSLAPFARLISAGTVVTRNDLQYERYLTPRPRPTWAHDLRPRPASTRRSPTGRPRPTARSPSCRCSTSRPLGLPDNQPDPPPVASLGVPGAPPIVRTEPASRPLVVAGRRRRARRPRRRRAARRARAGPLRRQPRRPPRPPPGRARPTAPTSWSPTRTASAASAGAACSENSGATEAVGEHAARRRPDRQPPRRLPRRTDRRSDRDRAGRRGVGRGDRLRQPRHATRPRTVRRWPSTAIPRRRGASARSHRSKASGSSCTSPRR